eukprot:68423-Rhodomonas_salina.3
MLTARAALTCAGALHCPSSLHEPRVHARPENAATPSTVAICGAPPNSPGVHIPEQVCVLCRHTAPACQHRALPDGCSQAWACEPARLPMKCKPRSLGSHTGSPPHSRSPPPLPPCILVPVRSTSQSDTALRAHTRQSHIHMRPRACCSVRVGSCLSLRHVERNCCSPAATGLPNSSLTWHEGCWRCGIAFVSGGHRTATTQNDPGDD